MANGEDPGRALWFTVSHFGLFVRKKDLIIIHYIVTYLQLETF